MTSAQLAGLEFTPTPGAYGQSSTFTYKVTDTASNASTGTATLTIADPDSPAITGLADVVTGQQGSSRPFASATVSDPTRNAVDTIRIALSGASGTLSVAGLVANADGTYTLGTASPAMLTSELDALTFMPSPPDGSAAETTRFALTVESNSGAVSTTASAAYTLDPPLNKRLFGSTTNDVTSNAGRIYALYEAILGRAPDPIGFENQVAAANAGTPLTTIAQSLIGSAEYAADHGSSVSSNSGYVGQLYQDGLHRLADAGAQGYVDALNAGSQSRAQVALSIATSQESQNDLAPTFQAGVFVPDASDSAVARLYYGLLSQAPDASGLQSAENAGTSIRQLTQSFLGSDDYRTTAVGQDNLAYVEGFYETALGRMGDAGCLSGYQGALDTGVLSRAGMADAFFMSNEFQSREAGASNDSYIDTVYQAALGRHADAGGLANWNAQLAGGTSRAAPAGRSWPSRRAARRPSTFGAIVDEI